MLHHHLPSIVYFLHTCILLEIVWTTRLDWILPTGGLNRVPKYRKKTFYLWYPENLFSGSYITCGAAVPVSVSYFTELCGSALKPSRHWSVWSAQLRDVGKGVWQVHGRFRHSLCQRDFWRLVWHKAVWTTYQRFSPSRAFFFSPPLYCAIVHLLLSFVSVSVHLSCAALLCVRLRAGLFALLFLSRPRRLLVSFASFYLAVFSSVEVSRLRDRFGNVRSAVTRCPRLSDAKDVSESCINIAQSRRRSFSVRWWITAISHCYSKCHPGIFASSYAC